MKAVVHDGTVRVGIARAIPQILESLGADPVELFAEAGIDLGLMDNPDNVFPYAARSHLINVCVERTGCEHFGLLLGQQGHLSDFGLIVYLTKHSPDVGSALRSLERLFHLHVQGAVIQVTVEDSTACLSYHIYEGETEAASQIEDGAMAWAHNIMRELCGRKFKPAEVRFAHRIPRDQGPYHKLFGAPIRFDSEQTGLLFPSHWLQRSRERADPELHRLLQMQVDELQSRWNDDYLAHLRRVLTSVLVIGPAMADEVAALFSMSSRTLDRRLNALGTTFREVAQEAKCQIACQMLNDSEIKVGDLADLLHYSDASAFIKAFKRWTGSTPSAWRKQHRPDLS
jgi:AraC-like DNA-binding protein